MTGHFDVPVILEDARPLGPDGSSGYECRVKNPAQRLDHAKREIVAARFFEIAADVIEQLATGVGGQS